MQPPIQRGHRLRNSFLIGCAAVALSTLGIQASDMASGIAGRLTGSAFTSTGPCGESEVLLRFGAYALCMDTYEASASAACPHTEVRSELQTIDNLDAPICMPATAPGVEPWRFVSFTQAEQLCARVGKRLPTADEWHRTAIGISDTSSCVLTASGPADTGSGNCVTPTGVHDIVGNVWEWLGETVSDGMFNGRHVPQSGYVDLVDDAGIVLRTSGTAGPAFGEDYAWVVHEGVRGILRGGFYQSGSDGGIFAQNMSVPLDFTTAGVGFRCVRDVQ